MPASAALAMTSGEATAIVAWGEALRAGRQHHRRMRRRARLAAIGMAALLATIAVPPAPRLLWNASASAPLGLYAVYPGAAIRRGDWVVAWPPRGVRDLAAQRRYLPRGVPLVKRAAGVPGDRICAVGDVVVVGRRRAVARRTLDALARPMPTWHGCVTLQDGAIFLLVPGVSASFDGRYFGPTTPGDIIGKATPLWPR